jgi:TRAP-type C4-dicarboxylate transport system permease small subunit
MVRLFRRLFAGISEGLICLAEICTIVMLLAVAGNAILRYFFGAPLIALVDWATIMLLLSTFLAFPNMAEQDDYISVALFRFRGRVSRRAAATVRASILLGFYLCLSIAAVHRAIEDYELKVATTYARIPLWPSSFVIAAMVLVAMAVYLRRALRRSRT